MSALRSINARLGSTLSPINTVNMPSASTVSSIRRRASHAASVTGISPGGGADPSALGATSQTDAGSMRHYSALDVGFTDRGLQVWCRRHQLNVVHVDFAGQALEADFRCLEWPEK